jgi:hypothetical protein
MAPGQSISGLDKYTTKHSHKLSNYKTILFNNEDISPLHPR